ncbi:unnamed protein product [Dimorphilus gyrociliatus]|uniref:Uncharacterized protein n=1 Tax=Dimorphilus gyrociliatus TaxID=2664684 RepID=A0A7I8VKE9_9ANNE|nr:unnamed protein product [Dimorphilus gyrociliatus]
MAEVDEDKIFEAFKQNITSIIDQLKTDNERSTESSLERLSQRIQVSNNIISASVTKLSVLYSKPPYPIRKDTRVIFNQTEQGLVALLSAFYNLGKNDGNLICSILKRNIIYVCESLLEFVRGMEKLELNEINNNEFRTLTGIVWSRCDAFAKLPKNNREAIVERLKDELGMIEDASGELATAQDNESADEFFSDLEDMPEPETWCESERNIVQAFQKVIELISSIVQNSIVAVQKSENITLDMDELYEQCIKVSPIIDDLVNSAYPPLDKSLLLKNIELLKNEVKKILKELPSYKFITEDDADWINQYEKDINEHFNDLIQLLSK